jgi:uncharacterized membrane protein HdeD (DUF308 family)
VSDDILTPEQIRALAHMWWLPVSLGVLSMVAGGIVLSRPDHSLRTLAVIIGIFVLIDGIVELYLSLVRRAADRAITAVLATLNLIVGVLLIRHPIAGVEATALLIGTWLIAVGAVRAVLAWERAGDRLGRLIVAAIEIFAGIVIVASGNIGYATLATLVGVSFIANGIGLVAFGILTRTLKDNGRRPGGVALAS